AGWEGAAIFAAAHLVEDAAPQSGFDDMQLSFAHRALEPEQQAVVEVGWVVHAILVENERIGQGTDLQQPVPVRIVSGEPGYLQAHADLRTRYAGIGYQMLEASAPRCCRTGFALIAVDDDDLLVTPSTPYRAAAKVVLALGALDVLHDLSHR